MENSNQKKLQSNIDLINAAGIDLEAISLAILNQFSIKSFRHNKSFGKLIKKLEKGIVTQKKVNAFVAKNISPTWISYVEPVAGEAIDLRKFLPEEDFLTYLSGIYISTHSTKVLDKEFMIKAAVSEMIMRTAAILKEKGLINESS